MFGRVETPLQCRCALLFTSFTLSNITISCFLIPKENIRCSITCVSVMEILATINLIGIFVVYLPWLSECRPISVFICQRATWGRFLVRFSFSDIHRDSSIKCRRSPTPNFCATKRCEKVRRRANLPNFTIEKSTPGGQIIPISNFGPKYGLFVHFVFVCKQ